jgi:hypothetical protein
MTVTTTRSKAQKEFQATEAKAASLYAWVEEQLDWLYMRGNPPKTDVERRAFEQVEREIRKLHASSERAAR